MEERNREQLLTMRFTTNADQNRESGGADSETAILIDRALEHNNALDVRNEKTIRQIKFPEPTFF